MKTSHQRLFHSCMALGLSGLLLTAILPHSRTVPGNNWPPAEEITRGPVGNRRVALTFDAGGGITGFPELLAALAAAHVHCTFFVTGKWASENPDYLREIHQAGHEIGNHTWSHPDLTKLDALQIRSELSRTETAIAGLTGQNPRPLFRAPYGARNERVLRVIHNLGYTSIYWTIDSLDSDPPPKTTAYLVHRITGKTNAALDGAIVLLHVGEPATAAAVAPILENLRSRNLSLVTVSTLLNLPAVPLPGLGTAAATVRTSARDRPSVIRR